MRKLKSLFLSSFYLTSHIHQAKIIFKKFRMYSVGILSISATATFVQTTIISLRDYCAGSLTALPAPSLNSKPSPISFCCQNCLSKTQIWLYWILLEVSSKLLHMVYKDHLEPFSPHTGLRTPALMIGKRYWALTRSQHCSNHFVCILSCNPHNQATGYGGTVLLLLSMWSHVNGTLPTPHCTTYRWEITTYRWESSLPRVG